ncbi:Protein ECERIFERUM 26 [Quillaja saponaria]|uniref:Protein ECERIFERUM 26 n=1 Tax=Quillaja saponaria TaxID=32244 RepID=A0AAD7QCZ9_QUISA|nr:Protein ECERIFERUM 26 [Quillaja saponaria]
MVLSQQEGNGLIYNFKISSVGPGWSSGSDLVHYPSGMDLAMKLHYLKVVYLFNSEAAQGLTIMRIKEAMFKWLHHYYIACGRFRRSDSGRPFMKYNDCGARLFEAKCEKTIDEWIEMKDWSLHWTRIIILSFSLNAASEFINSWGTVMAGLPLKFEKLNPMPQKPINPSTIEKELLSAKRVDPVGDHWITANNCKMDTFSFCITTTQLSNIQRKIWGPNFDQASIFESLCAIIWQCIAKVREGSETKIVTLCKNDLSKSGHGTLGNYQIISNVVAQFPIVDTDLKQLAALLVDRAVNERNEIEEAVERDNGVTDFFVYGANLTFVDLEEVDLYELTLKGHKPKFVYYTIEGVGNEGAVLVLPWIQGGRKDGGGQGRLVTIIFPENQMLELKSELKEKGVLLEVESDVEEE